MHHAHLVKKRPVFHYFAILDSVDDECADLNPLASRGQALKVSAVSALPGCASHYLVPLGDLIFYRKLSITESQDEDFILLQKRLAILRTTGKMSNKVRCKQFPESSLVVGDRGFEESAH